MLLALYTAFVWSRPIPAHFDAQDQLGAAAWQMVLLMVVVGGALALTVGFAASVLRSRYLRKGETDLQSNVRDGLGGKLTQAGY